MVAIRMSYGCRLLRLLNGTGMMVDAVPIAHVILNTGPP